MTTEIEEALTQSLHWGVAEPGWPQGDVRAAIAQGRRLHRRARLRVLGGVAAVALLATAGVQTLPEQRPRSPEPAASPELASGWTRLPDFPLSPRAFPIVSWLGDDLVVAGGSASSAGDAECTVEEPVEECEGLFDAAAYDFETGEWRRIADVPDVPGVGSTSLYEVGGTLVAGSEGEWYFYDAQADQWDRLPDPPHDSISDFGATSGSVAWGMAHDLAGHDGPDGQPTRIVSSAPLSLDLATRTWAEAPTAGLSPDFVLAQPPFVTDRGLVTVGIELPGGVLKSRDMDVLLPLVGYLLEGDRWTRLPDSDVHVDALPRVYWTGTRLISGPMPGDVGGAPGPDYSLDLFTGESERYDPPVELDPASASWPIYAGEGELYVQNGVLYDLRTGESREVGRPADATADDFFGISLHDGRLYVAGGTGHEPIENTSEVWVWTP